MFKTALDRINTKKKQFRMAIIQLPLFLIISQVDKSMYHLSPIFFYGICLRLLLSSLYRSGGSLSMKSIFYSKKSKVQRYTIHNLNVQFVYLIHININYRWIERGKWIIVGVKKISFSRIYITTFFLSPKPTYKRWSQ